MSNASHRDEKGEKLRVCPSCRMQISVLATKCRFCGEEVGKPKEEARTLSVHDLGGESVQHRAPSGSVMEALESFRVEEAFTTSGPPQLGGSSLDKDFGGSGARSSGSAFANARQSSAGKKRAKSNSSLIIGIVAGVAAVAALVFAGPALLAKLGGSEADASAPTFVNRAPGILASGGPAIDALQAAVEAIAHEDSAKNHGIAEEAVAAIDKEVRGLLMKTPFAMNNISTASSLASLAADLYPNDVSRKLVNDVQSENAAYKIILRNIDSTTRSATFVLTVPGSPEVTVQEGGMILDRFRVERIAAGVRTVTLADTKRQNRAVLFERGGQARAPN